MIKIKQILDTLDENGYKYDFFGNSDAKVEGFSSLKQYHAETLTWVRDRKVLSKVEKKDILCAIIQKGVDFYAQNRIVSENSKEMFFFILETFWGKSEVIPEIGENTYISKETVVSENVAIGHNCTLGGRIYIGAGTVIEDNVTIMNTVHIGENCIIHSGAVIGRDGFGYSFDKNNIPQKVKHFGGVIIGDRVEIGANTCIARGTIDNTMIGNDTKIDALVQVGHNVILGAGVLIVSHSVLGGSARIGDKCYLALGSIIKDQVEIGCNTFIGMGRTVDRDTPDNMMLLETPSEEECYNIDYRRFL